MAKDSVTREQVIEWGKLAGFESSLHSERNLERLGDFAIFARMNLSATSAQAVDGARDEREAFDAWLANAQERGHACGSWGAWQARAALASTEAAGEPKPAIFVDLKQVARLMIKHGGHVDSEGWVLNQSGLHDFLHEYLRAPGTPTVEPVAWRHSYTHFLYEEKDEVPLTDGDEWAEPLYTAPPAASQPNSTPQSGIPDELKQAGLDAHLRRLKEQDIGMKSEEDAKPCGWKGNPDIVQQAAGGQKLTDERARLERDLAAGDSASGTCRVYMDDLRALLRASSATASDKEGA